MGKFWPVGWIRCSSKSRTPGNCTPRGRRFPRKSPPSLIYYIQYVNHTRLSEKVIDLSYLIELSKMVIQWCYPSDYPMAYEWILQRQSRSLWKLCKLIPQHSLIQQYYLMGFSNDIIQDGYPMVLSGIDYPMGYPVGSPQRLSHLRGLMMSEGSTVFLGGSLLGSF